MELSPARGRFEIYRAACSLRSSIEADPNQVKETHSRASSLRKNFSNDLVSDADGTQVVPLACVDGEVGSLHANFDLVVVLGTIDVVGNERERILISCLFGDVGIHALKLRLLGGGKFVAAGADRVFIEL